MHLGGTKVLEDQCAGGRRGRALMAGRGSKTGASRV